MAHAGGRPSNYKKEYSEQAYNYCLLGATDKDMAGFFNVAESTFNKWKLDHPEFSESLKRGKVEADAVIASKLFHRAKGYEHPDIVTASYQGEITDIKTITKYYPPDTTAGIFWLKNRQPEKWRDKQEVESRNINENHNYDESTQAAIYALIPPDKLKIVVEAQAIVDKAEEEYKKSKNT